MNMSMELQLHEWGSSMEQYKINLDNLSESKEAQDLFFAMGYKWFNERYEHTGLLTIYADNEGYLSSTATIRLGGESAYTDITLDQLRNMAKKEYLDDNYNLVYYKTDIEVPEGSEIATLSPKKKVSMWKDEGASWWHSEHNEWKKWGGLHNHVDNLGHVVVWQRTPSVDGEDTVNHPNHYASGAVECIEAIESSMSAEAFKGFLKGNVQKYMWRYEQKGGAESLEKAQWYLNMLLSRVSS